MEFILTGSQLLKDHSGIFEESFDEWREKNQTEIDRLIACNRLYQSWSSSRENLEEDIPELILQMLLECSTVRIYLDNDHSQLLKALGVPEGVEIEAKGLVLSGVKFDITADLSQPNLGLIPEIACVQCVIEIPISMTEEQIQEELESAMHSFTTLYHNSFLNIGNLRF